jgi:hypothetical protein
MIGLRQLSAALRLWRTAAEERRALARAVAAALDATARAAPELRAALRSARGRVDRADHGPTDTILVAVGDWDATWDLPPGWLDELRRHEQIVVLVRVRNAKHP